MQRVLAMICAAATLGTVQAQVRLFGLFSNNMVLQRDVTVPVWGSAAPGERVAVQFGGQAAMVKADPHGQWRVELAPMPAGGPFELTVTGGNNVITLRNVMVGDVWLCGGQSNMVYQLRQALGSDELVAENLPGLRLVRVDAPVRGQPSAECHGGQWSENQPAAAAFSAVGYTFGRELHKRYGVPIGLVQCAAGGSVAEAWTPREAMADNPVLEDMIQIVDQAIADHQALLDAWPERFDAWLEEADERERRGLSIPRPPGLGHDPRINPYRPAGMYNGGIAPLTGFPIRGVVWYQGESNGSFAYQYRELLPALIQAWRSAWNQPDMPFLIVQLPTYRPNQVKHDGSSWAELREAQLMTWQRLDNTGMAVTIDLGADPRQDSLHPPDKIPIGRRLALAARALVYGEDIVHSGPIWKTARVEGNKVHLTFTHTGSGLLVRGDTPRGFTIAGEDRQFRPAEAGLDGDTVVVWSTDVDEPAAVRYNWDYEPKPLGNLYNREGLPASPFRTDEWPGVTAEAKYWW